MQRYAQVGGSILFLALLVPLYSQQPISWRDSSPHTIQLITVDKDVRLEVLDWGSRGRGVVLLAGGGNTAHVYDEFAPKLASDFHVYGITRRGFGASGFAAPEGTDRLGDDVLAVIDALKLNRPVIVGHSIAGAELSSVAASHPDRIAGVIYLEAAYPYAFDNSKGATMQEFLDLQMRGPHPPTPRNSDLVSFSALQKWDVQTYGYRMPESEFRQTWESNSEGRPMKARDFPGSSMFGMIMAATKKHTDIRVPALVICAIPHLQDPWMTKSSDPEIRKAAGVYFKSVDALAEKQTMAVETGVPSARVVRLRGMHYIFISNERDVLREMRTFLAGLR